MESFDTHSHWLSASAQLFFFFLIIKEGAADKFKWGGIRGEVEFFDTLTFFQLKE